MLALRESQRVRTHYRTSAIIWQRACDQCAELERPAATNLRGRDSDCDCSGSSDVWPGLRRVSSAGGGLPERLRLGDCESLLRCAAEERKDAVHLRSTTGSDLRERAVSPRGFASLLVLESTSRSAYRYLAGSWKSGPSEPALSLPKGRVKWSREQPGFSRWKDRDSARY